MKIEKKYIAIFIALTITTIGLTIGLTATSVDLLEEKQQSLATISEMTEKINQLENQVAGFQSDKKKINYYKFLHNVFQLRHPSFTKTAQTVFKKSNSYGFNPYLIMAVIQVESSFNRYAVSRAGAYGLMQINYSVWKDELDIDRKRIFQTDYNIELGLRVLKHYYDKASGNIFLALFRYNNGYRYKNTAYNGKIAATKFYPHSRKKMVYSEDDKETDLSTYSTF